MSSIYWSVGYWSPNYWSLDYWPVIPVAPIPVNAGGTAEGGSIWDERFAQKRTLPAKKRIELTNEELIAILLAADEEFYEF